MDRLPLASSLFPPAVAVRAFRFGADPAAALAQLRALDPRPLPDGLARAVQQRRLDFCAGRYCAREALRACAPALADSSIPIGANREPVWPAGIVGSIAHSRGHAVAAVAAASGVRAIGVDIEPWLDEGAPARLAADLTVAGELAVLAEATGWPPSRLLTLLFSAKETLFKCLFPQVQAYFGFQQARIVGVWPEAGTFTATIETALGPWAAGNSFVGRYQCLDAVVVTSLTLVPGDPEGAAAGNRKGRSWAAAAKPGIRRRRPGPSAG